MSCHTTTKSATSEDAGGSSSRSSRSGGAATHRRKTLGVGSSPGGFPSLTRFEFPRVNGTSLYRLSGYTGGITVSKGSKCEHSTAEGK